MKRMIRREQLGLSYLLLAASLQFPLAAFAQVAGVAPVVNVAPQTTILPTDTLPLPAVQNRMTFAENLQLRILQKLPAKFYFNATCETSVRDETNPFQFPRKQSLMRQLPPPQQFAALPILQQVQLYNEIGEVARNDAVFRVLPNVTGGWALYPHTRIYGNYFMIRDQLAHETQLNTVIHSIGMGIQQDIPVTAKGNLQAEFQWRELYQLHQQSVFDFLPGLTFSYVYSPRVVLFANSLFQLRGKDFFQSPNKEMDPFYTWGGLYQRNGWTFSASTTFVQNFRQPFTSQSTIPVNNYSFISDYEISRRVIKQLPGLQAFVRAEPIWNFHGKDKPGLSGMDFRLFCGLRFAIAKPALTSALEQLRQQLEEQEQEPGTAPGEKKPAPAVPSAYVAPQAHELVASSPQPIHGFFDEVSGQEGAAIPVTEFANYQDNSSSAAKPNDLSQQVDHEVNSLLNKNAKSDPNGTTIGPIGLVPSQAAAALGLQEGQDQLSLQQISLH